MGIIFTYLTLTNEATNPNITAWWRKLVGDKCSWSKGRYLAYQPLWLSVQKWVLVFVRGYHLVYTHSKTAVGYTQLLTDLWLLPPRLGIRVGMLVDERRPRDDFLILKKNPILIQNLIINCSICLGTEHITNIKQSCLVLLSGLWPGKL